MLIEVQFCLGGLHTHIFFFSPSLLPGISPFGYFSYLLSPYLFTIFSFGAFHVGELYWFLPGLSLHTMYHLLSVFIDHFYLIHSIQEDCCDFSGIPNHPFSMPSFLWEVLIPFDTRHVTMGIAFSTSWDFAFTWPRGASVTHHVT